MPNCPYCNRASFELEEAAVAGLPHRPTFIQCSGCKAPVGAIELKNVTQQIPEFENRIVEYLRLVTQILQQMSSRLDRIEETQKNLKGHA